jgi:hypothetical protein
MSIFKTEVPEDVCCSTDQVVSAVVDPRAAMFLPGFRITSDKDVVNTQRGAVRRKGNSNG